ncbi:MAG: AAA family ATPase [Lachnospiraceae bacterium]|nr:AAA family ATPase [Lachnospiraceae bacterium]
MNIKRAKQEIKNAVAAYLEKDENGDYRIPPVRQRPILLMGAPGIGKTQIMEQVAGECDLALVSYTITHHTRQSAIGLPFIRERVYGGENRSITEYTMSEIIAAVYDRMEESGKKEGILFIDEINCASETLAPTMLQFLQGKSFGNQKVPEGWIIVAAGNPPEYNKSVREFDVVTLDRVKVIPVEPDYETWKEYAYENGLHGAILAYLDIHKENFYRMETSVDGKQFVTPRGWHDLSEMLFACERLNMPSDRELIGQYLQHPRAAKDFANYLELYRKYRSDYQIDEILSGTIRPGTKNKLKFAPFDERLEVVSLLLTRLAENFRLVYRLEANTDRLYEVLKMAKARGALFDTPDWKQILGDILEEKQQELTLKIASGQNERQLKAEYKPVLQELESYLQQLARAAVDEPERDGFDLIRESFGAYNEKREATVEMASRQLEYAFDFMEEIFGESQEMIVFITELAASPQSAEFLRTNPCDRYFMYNKSLLFEDREAAVREQLDEIRNLQIT